MLLDDLEGKRVLITGASTGIGAAAAKAFAEHGAVVAAHYNKSEAEARALQSEVTDVGGRMSLAQGDLCDPAQCAAVVEKAVAALGGLDVLINNAGGKVEPTSTEGYTDELFDRVTDLNIRSVLATTRATIPHLKAAGGGAIINTGSVAGRNGGGPGSVLYAAAKAYVHSLTRGMAIELAEHKIRVNAVAPGLILTPFHADADPKRLDSVRNSLPLKRLGEAEDCVGAYLYLASERMGGYVTGAIIDVNGGRLMP